MLKEEYTVSVRRSKGINHFGDQGVDGIGSETSDCGVISTDLG
jgi:hypothetical protein